MANGSSPQPDEGAEKRRTWRRPLIIAIAILTTFVVYAFAFAKTDVSLDEIQSEQRQTQLFNILRALAKPDLIHYDAERLIVTADVFVPCNGSEPDSVAPDPTGATIEVTPTCASPGEILTVEGAGFEPGKRVIVNFIPRSDFDIFLRQGTTNVADDGAFTLSFEVPSRESEDSQQVQVITETNIGAWANRVSVWTDTNLNGVEDPSALPASDAPMSTVVLQLPEFHYRNPGGVTLIDKNNNVLDFISWGGSFEATTGSGTGHVSRDIETDPFNTGPLDSVQLAGSGVSATDFDGLAPNLRASARSTADRFQRTRVHHCSSTSCPSTRSNGWKSLDHPARTCLTSSWSFSMEPTGGSTRSSHSPTRPTCRRGCPTTLSTLGTE